jgi:hypothetical protein
MIVFIRRLSIIVMLLVPCVGMIITGGDETGVWFRVLAISGLILIATSLWIDISRQP